MTGHRWQPISPPDANFGYDFAEIDALHRQWLTVKAHQEAAQPHIYAAFLERLTRSWAIETGIIEGLYTLDQGMTETLVANGISADLIERSSTNKDPQELAQILDDHQRTVAGVYAEIRAGRPITLNTIRQIHSAITEHQPTYRAFNPSVGWFNATLERGTFKRLPNNPTRPDGALHEYCPPEQVDSELDNLLEWYAQYQQDTNLYHPLLTAAWLHHRFVQIHPFQDGNGRVVRALLTWHLVRHNYLPVVVTRDDRSRYISTLERADAGDLVPFVDLLVQMQRRTILYALGEPESDRQTGLVDQVLDDILDRMHRRNEILAGQSQAASDIARLLRDQIADFLNARAGQIGARFIQSGQTLEYRIEKGGPGDKEHWYRSQVVQTAINSGHWVNLNEPRFFAKLSLTPGPASHLPRLTFVASLHHTGRIATGIMAATAFAHIEHYSGGDAERTANGWDDSFRDCTPAPFTFTGENPADAWFPRCQEWTEQCLAMALRLWQ